jgi:hypothetical protein
LRQSNTNRSRSSGTRHSFHGMGHAPFAPMHLRKSVTHLPGLFCYLCTGSDRPLSVISRPLDWSSTDRQSL